MEKYYGIVIGNQVKVKHLDKISMKFSRHCERATALAEEQTVEIWLELYDPSANQRDFYNVVLVQKEYFPRYIEIMSQLNFDFVLCDFQHGHISATVENVSYSSTTYRSLDGATYFFYECEENEENILWKRLEKLPIGKQYHCVPRLLDQDEYQLVFTQWIKSVLADSQIRK